jgi:hypothetical protein
MKILLIDSDPVIRANHKTFCESLPINAQFFEAHDISLAMDSKVLAEIDFILCLDKGQNNEQVALFKNYIGNNFPQKGFVIAKDEGTDVDQKVLASTLVDFYSQLNNVSFEYDFEEYLAVRIIYFLRYNKNLKDIYIKISQDKYLKVFREGTCYNRDDILKYKDKGATHLYVLASDFENGVENIEHKEFLSFDKELDTNSSEDTFSNTIEVIQDLIKETGIDQQIVNMVDYTVYKIEEQLTDKKDNLALVMKKFQRRGDYLSDSAYAVSYMSCMLCSKMNWDTEETRQKLIFASMLHDVFVDNVAIAKAMDFGEDISGCYASHLIDDYKLHPIKIAEKIKKNTKLPMNLEELVLCHHELPDGSGFPRGYDSHRITQLSAVFNIARNFVNLLFKYDFDEKKIPKILSHFIKHYNVGNYKQPLKALIASFPLAASQASSDLD